MADPQTITIDDLRSVLPGGDGFSTTFGVGLTLALDTMTAAARDLEVASLALEQSSDNCDVVSAVVSRISMQLESVAKICWRVAGQEQNELDPLATNAPAVELGTLGRKLHAARGEGEPSADD